MVFYSSLNASIDFTTVAMCAGINPINVPKNINVANAIKIIGMLTVGFTKAASSPEPTVESIINNIKPFIITNRN